MENPSGVRGRERVRYLHRVLQPVPSLSLPCPITWASDGPATYSIAMKSTSWSWPMS